jgi:phenylpropionate dioxygenase-like ring-hydroxylating dioxygenase large terminal subunit
VATRLRSEATKGSDPAARRVRVGRAEVDALLALGLRNRWYGLCPSRFVADRPVGLIRLGERLVVWRDAGGRIRVQDDRCPHRGAPLSHARHLGDRLACAYHGVEVAGDGTVVAVPGMPESNLVGRCAVAAYPALEHQGCIFAWFGDALHGEPVPFRPPEQIASDDHAAFLCYGEWACPWRFPVDNNMDPMHGTFLHAQSHSMARGRKSAAFHARETATGFVFEKADQRDTNFDWSEWWDTGFQCIRLEIPYPATGGPGGNFGIVFHATPIDGAHTACFVWRNRKVQGWRRDAWRFLYRNRLEARHWQVLEQDRRLLEALRPDADRDENLYDHDTGLARVRRLLRREAEAQIRALKAAGLARREGAHQQPREGNDG